MRAGSNAKMPKQGVAAGKAALVLASGRGKPSGYAGQSPMIEDIPGIRVDARILELDRGLYALSIAEIGSAASEHSGILLPAVHLSTPPSNHLGEAEIIAADDDSACWVGCEGATIVIKAPLGGGHVLLTTYERRGQPDEPREITVRRIDVPQLELVETRVADATSASQTHDLRMEVLLHIEGAGDRRMSAEGWIGNRGRKLRLEAFSVRPLETLAPTDIEYKAYGPNGRETPWIRDGKICGTRGRSLPLTGFAVRLAAQLRHRFGIEYHGAFFESGICGPIRNGEPCMARIADDPLEALKLRLFERVDP